MIPARQPIIVVGLGFGDEAKGATVDFLCSQGDVAGVVRFNGGAQAAHNVVVDGRHHTFRQFGSGTLSGVPTYLSRFSLVEPIGLAGEAEELAGLGVPDPLSMITVDPDALLTTPVHVAANRTREDRRGDGRHGSTGLGIGETVWYDLALRRGARAGQRVENLVAPADARGARALRVRDCLDGRVTRERLTELARFYAPLLAGSAHGHDDVGTMADLLAAFAGAVRIAGPDQLARTARDGRLVFEGAQGVLLDEGCGFHPHTTWSTTTPANAQALLAEAGLPRGYVLGLTRAYTTRHGAGPLPTEDPALLAVAEPFNGTGTYQGGWRAGHLDLVALRYAVDSIGGVDGLAVSHLDVLDEPGVAVRAIGAYETGRGPVDRLPVGPVGDLAHQEALTGLLRDAVGCGRRLAHGRDAVDTLERVLGAPAQVLGFGPARADRKFA